MDHRGLEILEFRFCRTRFGREMRLSKSESRKYGIFDAQLHHPIKLISTKQTPKERVGGSLVTCPRGHQTGAELEWKRVHLRGYEAQSRCLERSFNFRSTRGSCMFLLGAYNWSWSLFQESSVFSTVRPVSWGANTFHGPLIPDVGESQHTDRGTG